MSHNDPESLAKRGLTPAISERTTYISAGAITIGIEPIVMTDETVTAFRTNRGIDLPTARQLMNLYELHGGIVRESGISIHVYGGSDREPEEFLRFDCFAQKPHYHYIYVSDDLDPVRVHLDVTANGESIAWAIDCVKNRLPQMLEYAGAAQLANQIDQEKILAAIPDIRTAAHDTSAQVPLPNAEWIP